MAVASGVSDVVLTSAAIQAQISLNLLKVILCLLLEKALTKDDGEA